MGTLEQVAVGMFGRVLEATWQACVLAVLVLALQWVLRKRISAQWRYALWGVVVVRLLVPVLPPSPASMYSFLRATDTERPFPFVIPREVEFADMTPVPGQEEGPAKAGRSQATPVAERPVVPSQPRRPQRFGGMSTGNRDLPWMPQDAAESLDPKAAGQLGLSLAIVMKNLAWIWVTGACLLFGNYLFRSVRCRRQIRQGWPIRSAATLTTLDDCARLLRISRRVTIVETHLTQGPALIGWRVPRILVPPGLLHSLEPDQIRHVLLHELAHLRRRDLWTNQLLGLLSSVHWFNPAVYYVVRRIRNDMESACDATVLRHLRDGEARGYGRSILGVLENIQPARPIAGALPIIGGKRDLWRRFRAIVDYPSRRGYGWAAAVAGVVLAVVGLTGPSPQPQAGAARSATPAESAGARVELIAKDAAADQPVTTARASWQVSGLSGREVAGQGTLDAAGKLNIPLPEDGLSGLTLSVEAEGYWPWAFELNPVSAAARLNSLRASLLKVSPVGGRLLDLEDNPVAGATIQLHVETADDWMARLGTQRYAPKFLETYTRPDGTWRIEDAVPSPSRPSGVRVRLEVSHPEYVGGFQVWGAVGGRRNDRGARALQAALAEWPMTTNMTLRVGREADVGGRVVTTEGEPIPGAKITFTPPFLRPSTGDPKALQVDLVADEEGRFSVRDVTPVVLPYESTGSRPQIQWGGVRVEAEGFVARSVSVASQRSGEGLMEIVLQRGLLARGRLVDENGRPVGRQRVNWAGGSGGIESTTTDSEGRFMVGPVSGHEVEIRLRGYSNGLRYTLRTGEPEQVITYVTEPQIEVAAIDADNGLPLERFDAYLVRPGLLRAHFVFAEGPGIGSDDTTPTEVLPKLAATNGVIRIAVRDAEQLGLPPRVSFGKEPLWWIKVEAKGYLPMISDGFAPGEGARISLSLPPAPWLEGTVVNSRGEPISGAHVGYVANPYPREHLVLDGFSSSSRYRGLVSDRASVAPEDGMMLRMPLCLQTSEPHTTDDQGRFALPPRNPNIAVQVRNTSVLPTYFERPVSKPRETNDFVVVVHATGIAEIPIEAFQTPQIITLQPLGALRVKVGHNPDQAKGWKPTIIRRPLAVELGGDPRIPPGPAGPDPSGFPTETDTPGVWLIQNLPPGRCSVQFLIPTGPNSYRSGKDYTREVEVLPGATNEFSFFANTLSLQGRFTVDVDSALVNWRGQPFGSSAKALQQPQNTLRPQGLVSRTELTEGEKVPFVSPLYVEESGAFKIASVEPGEYTLRFTLVEPPSLLDHELLPPLPNSPRRPVSPGGPSTRRRSYTLDPMSESFSTWDWTRRADRWFLEGFSGGVPVAQVAKDITVPPPTDVSSPDPIDLGVVELEVQERLKLGQTAPDLNLAQPDLGFELRGVRGKWALLIFTSQSLQSYEREELTLQHYADELRSTGKIEVVVFDLDAEPPAAHESGKEMAPDSPWRVIPLGSWRKSPVAAAYCVRAIPEIVLLNPEGRIAGLHLRGQRLLDVVDAISPPSGAPAVQ